MAFNSCDNSVLPAERLLLPSKQMHCRRQAAAKIYPKRCVCVCCHAGMGSDWRGSSLLPIERLVPRQGMQCRRQERRGIFVTRS